MEQSGSALCALPVVILEASCVGSLIDVVASIFCTIATWMVIHRERKVVAWFIVGLAEVNRGAVCLEC